jgi:AsmA protein
MKKVIKILSAVLVVLVVLVVVLIALVNILITPENVRETLLPLAEENLYRKVELGDIEVSLLSGIEIHGLKIYEKGDDDVFVSTGLMRLKYQLLPLLAMKVVVDEVSLVKPEIRIERLKDGSFNFSDLLGDANKDPSGNRNSSSEQPSLEQQGSSISLLVSKVLLKDGQLTFLDYALNNKSPYRYQLSALQLVAKGVSLTGKVPLSIQCQLNGSLLTLNGDINLVPLGADLDVELKKLDVIAFKPYLIDVVPGKLGGLKLSIKTAVSGTMDEVALRGGLSLAGLDLILDALPEAPINDAALDVNFDLQLLQSQEKLRVDQLELDYNGIKVDAIGDISSVLSDPSLQLDITLPALQIRQALAAVPAGLVGDVSSFDPAGTVSAKAKIAGGLSEAHALLKTASVDLDNVQATAGGYRPALTGRLSIVGDQVTSNGLSVRLGDNKADIDLVAKHLFAQPVIVRADITSDRFELEPLLQGGAGSTIATDQSENVDGGGQSSQEEVGPFDLPLQASGSIKVAEAVWKGLTIKDFLASYELKDNILDLKRMDGQLAGGSFSNSARVDLGKKGLAYSASLGLKTIKADPLLTALAPKAAGSLLGAMNLDLNIKGRGTQWELLSKQLSGQGDMLVVDGRVVSPGLVTAFASFLQLPDMDEITFSNFKGDIKIVNGKVQLDSSLLSDQLKLFPKGTVGLDGMLNLSLDTRLSPQLSSRLDSKGKVSRYLTDKDGWSQFPLLVSGNYADPSIGLDPKGLQDQATRALSNELGRQINKFFGGNDPEAGQTDQQQSSETASPPEESVNKLLQDSLQKLFGN